MTGAFGEWLPDRPNTLVIAGAAAVSFYRCEVDGRGVIRFADLTRDARSRLGSELEGRTT